MLAATLLLRRTSLASPRSCSRVTSSRALAGRGTTDDVGIGTYFIPGGQTGNPFPHDAEVYYRFADVGNRGDDGTSTLRVWCSVSKAQPQVGIGKQLQTSNRIKIDTFATNNALNSRVMCLTNLAAAAAYAAGGDPLGL